MQTTVHKSTNCPKTYEQQLFAGRHRQPFFFILQFPRKKPTSSANVEAMVACKSRSNHHLRAYRRPSSRDQQMTAVCSPTNDSSLQSTNDSCLPPCRRRLSAPAQTIVVCPRADDSCLFKCRRQLSAIKKQWLSVHPQVTVVCHQQPTVSCNVQATVVCYQQLTVSHNAQATAVYKKQSLADDCRRLPPGAADAVAPQSRQQGLFFLGLGCGQSTARMASSKTFLSPFWVRAEHSRYLTEPISLAMARPCG